MGIIYKKYIKKEEGGSMESIFSQSSPGSSGSIFDQKDSGKDESIYAVDSSSTGSGSIYEKKKEASPTSILDGANNNQSVFASTAQTMGGGTPEGMNNDLTNLNQRGMHYGGNSVIDAMRGTQARRLNNDGGAASLAESYGDSSLDTRFVGGKYNTTLTDIYQDRTKFEASMGIMTGMVTKDREDDDLKAESSSFMNKYDDKMTAQQKEITSHNMKHMTSLEKGINKKNISNLTASEQDLYQDTIKNMTGGDREQYLKNFEMLSRTEKRAYMDAVKNLSGIELTEFQRKFSQLAPSQREEALKKFNDTQSDAIPKNPYGKYKSLDELQEKMSNEEHKDNISGGKAEKEHQIVQDFRKLDLDTKIKMIKGNQLPEGLPNEEKQRALRELNDRNFAEKKAKNKKAEAELKVKQKKEKKELEAIEYQNMLREKRENERAERRGVKRKGKDGKPIINKERYDPTKNYELVEGAEALQSGRIPVEDIDDELELDDEDSKIPLDDSIVTQQLKLKETKVKDGEFEVFRSKKPTIYDEEPENLIKPKSVSSIIDLIKKV